GTGVADADLRRHGGDRVWGVAREQADGEAEGAELADGVAGVGAHFVLEAEGGTGGIVAAQPDFGGGIGTGAAEPAPGAAAQAPAGAVDDGFDALPRLFAQRSEFDLPGAETAGQGLRQRVGA